MSVLSVQNVGKAFRSYGSEWQRFARWFGLPVKPNEEHWVLRNVSFEIQQGEAIGIIGQNGAGKSTLLKMITGTSQPSEGQVRVNGKIAAILELGMGFNPDLTGRENAYHGLGLMGYNHAEVEQVMSKLEAFADIGDYFDQPVRVYSSGMQMRVAFAVVTARRPEVLIVDEVLAVGDMYFQHKCMAKIREFQREGTSLLLVSHDPGAVRSLCDRAVMLESGSVIKVGAATEVMDYYQAFIVKEEYDLNIPESKGIDVNQKSNLSKKDKKILISEDVLKSVKISLLDEHDRIVDHLVTGMLLNVKVDVEFNQAVEDPHIGFGIRNRFGDTIYETNTFCLQHNLGLMPPDKVLSVFFSFRCDIGHGDYQFVLGITNKGFDTGSFEEVIFYDQNITPLRIIPTYKDYWAGYFNLRPTVTWSLNENNR